MEITPPSTPRGFPLAPPMESPVRHRVMVRADANSVSTSPEQSPSRRAAVAVVRPEDVVFEQRIASHATAPAAADGSLAEHEVKPDEVFEQQGRTMSHAEKVAQIDPVRAAS